MAIKTFDPITVEAEIRDKTVTLKFNGSPGMDGLPFMNGLKKDQKPADFFEVIAADELTKGVAAEIPEPELVMLSLQTIYRRRMNEITMELTADPKLSEASSASSPATPADGSTKPEKPSDTTQTNET